MTKTPADMISDSRPLKITLIGSGTIGLSFAALHIQSSSSSLPLQLTIYDTRPDLKDYILQTLPSYLNAPVISHPDQRNAILIPHLQHISLNLDYSLPSAVSHAHIIQEQGPENPSFKTSLWPQVEAHAPPTSLFWSSTSGIPASIQSAQMREPPRLLVVHPYNPPHIMPLLEIVPSPETSQSVIDQTMHFWESRGRTPILVKKECTGFIANRLAFALLREAIHLVDSGVASVEDVDQVVTSSMGPRWAVAGPFKSYHAGGGEGGLKAWFQKIGGTVQNCWNDSGKVNMGESWETKIFVESQEAYGIADVRNRDEKTKRVLDAAR